jgi:tRNA A-37 threonylcarbamoyl transferase component Bud32
VSQPNEVFRGAPRPLDALFGPDGPHLAELLEAGQARVVKHGPHRTVYRVELPGLDVHVKHYRATSRVGRLRNAFTVGPAWREHELTCAVAARGVPTLEPLAVVPAEQGGAYLVTRTLPGVVPLEAVIEGLPERPATEQAQLRIALARALGRFLARLHKAGVAHEDLHPGNLLVALDNAEPCLYLIDLLAARVGKPLPWPARRDNLVILNRWFALRSARADRLRCWRAYEREWGARKSSTVPLDLEARTLASNLRFWRQQDGRCLSRNRHFRPVAAGACSGHAVTDLPAEALAPFLVAPDEMFTRPGVRVLKHSRSSTVAELDLPGGRRVIFKRFAVTAWSDPLVALLRPTGALRSWVLGHGLRLRGLPTPRPLAMFHRARYGLPAEGYLLLEKLPDALALDDWLRSVSTRPAGEARALLRGLIDQVARLVRLLHARHLAHRDLKAANLLVSPARWRVLAKGVKEVAAPAESKRECPPQAWFVDLVGVSRQKQVRLDRCVRDLARLNRSFYEHPGVTRADRVRFLRVYLAWGVKGRMGWKRWWRQIEKATKEGVERNRRRGRPLG